MPRVKDKTREKARTVVQELVDEVNERRSDQKCLKN